MLKAADKKNLKSLFSLPAQFLGCLSGMQVVSPAWMEGENSPSLSWSARISGAWVIMSSGTISCKALW